MRTIDLSITDRCNLRCGFCYIKKKFDNPKGEISRNLKFMDWIVKQFRESQYYEKYPDKRIIQINLYGGEPSVAWDSINALLNYTKEISDIKIYYSIITNMSLMNEEKINYCIKNHIGIHPSIDGCKEVEDMFRKTINGSTVSDQVFRNARILISKLSYRSCRSTICPETAQYMFKSIKFLCEEIGFKIVNQILAEGCDWNDNNLEIVKEQVSKITDWWIEKMRKGEHYSLYYIRNMLLGIWNPMRRRKLCSSGLSRCAIDTSGNIWPCHRFCNEDTPKEYLLGTINTGVTNFELMEKLRNFDMAEYHKEKCSKCIAVNSCHALCLHEMMNQGKGMFEPVEHYCKLWPFYYTEAMRAHSILVAEKNQFYLNLYKPQRSINRLNLNRKKS